MIYFVQSDTNLFFHMTTQQDDSLEYLPTLFFIPEHDPFPFFDLPQVVQWKILSQYVPLFDKTQILGQIPEFSDLLLCRSSWLDVSDSFAGLVSALRSLREGLYVIHRDLPDHGYHVEMDSEKSILIFTLCCFIDRMYVFTPIQVHRFDISAPVTNLCDFLTFFLKNYIPADQKQILAYRFHKIYSIFINTCANVAMWIDGRIIEMKNNKAVTGDSGLHFNLKYDNTLELDIRGCKDTLVPESLESHILMDHHYWEEGVVPLDRKVCRFQFSFEEKETISLSVETINRFYCRKFRNEDLFDLLSKSIMKQFRRRLNSL